MAIALMGMGANQIASAGVLDRPDFNDGNTVWIIRAGANFNSEVGDWKDAMEDGWKASHSLPLTKSNFSSNTSFDVSVAFNKSFKTLPIYWGMELGISTRGYKADAMWYKGQASSFGDFIAHTIKQNQKLTAYNVNLTPIMVGYKYNLMSNMTLDAHLGGVCKC